MLLKERKATKLLDEVRDRIRNFDTTLSLLTLGVDELNKQNHKSYVHYDLSKKMQIAYLRFDRSDFVCKLEKKYGFKLSKVEESDVIEIRNITGC